MPTIMFPDIPLYPGVPQLLRPISQAIAANPVLSIGLGTAETLLITALNQAPQWGIFDQSGNQLGINSSSGGILSAVASTLLAQIRGNNPTVLSTFDFEYRRENKISDFKTEAGGFAQYNKVQMPATPRVTLILDGSENDRTAFLEAMEDAANSTELYNVVTPEIVYANYNIVSYQYARKASKGLTLLIVEVFLEEVRSVSSSYAQGLIVAPVNPAATDQENNGVTQAAAPAASTVLTLQNQVSTFFSSFFGGGSQ